MANLFMVYVDVMNIPCTVGGVDDVSFTELTFSVAFFSST